MYTFHFHTVKSKNGPKFRLVAVKGKMSLATPVSESILPRDVISAIFKSGHGVVLDSKEYRGFTDSEKKGVTAVGDFCAEETPAPSESERLQAELEPLPTAPEGTMLNPLSHNDWEAFESVQ